MNTIDCDVAIIGAGPGGSTLASLLARAGLAVVLIDRDKFPRDKLCGEFLSYDALPILDEIGALEAIDRAGAAKIRRCRIVGATRAYQFDFPSEARGISRRTMDDVLVRHATRAGARAFEGWTADGIEHRDEHSLVSIRYGENAQTILARRVCGAWGRWGRFDRMLSREFTQRDVDRNFGFKRHYLPLSGSTAPPPDTIDLYSFDRGYLGVNWIEGGQTNICGLVHEARLSGHRGGWPTFIDALRAERGTLERLYAGHRPAQDEFLSSEPVVFTPRSVVENRIMLIGDAAGLIDPLAGNGMAMAIQSAALAAPLLIRSLREEMDRESTERAWVDAHAALFSRRLRWSRRAAWLLCRPHLIEIALRGNLPSIVGRALLERTRATTAEVARLVDHYRTTVSAGRGEPRRA